MATPGLIIGLGHRKRVGKDTFAGFLEEELTERGYDVYHLSFARNMKDIAETLFGMYGLRDAYHYEHNPEQREQVLPRILKSPRQLWIEFGNAVRYIFPEIWVDRLRDQMESCSLHNTMNPGGPAAFIITDVRYLNEACAIRSMGGKLIKVNRAEVPPSDDVADSALANYTGWDREINNDLTLDYLSRMAGIVARDYSEQKA